MEITFFVTSAVFIIFILISYYLEVIRLSVPLIVIYLVYCFHYLINNDKKITYDSSILTPRINNTNQNDSLLLNEKLRIEEKKFLNNKNQYIEQSSLPKPIVSLIPKPIFIDSGDVNNSSEKKINQLGVDTLKNIIKNPDDSAKNINTLKLNEIMICRGIYKRNPIKPGFNFINNVDSLFCYTKISNTGPKQEVKHLWYHKDKQISSVVYNIKTSYNYRSWSKKTIYPKQTGDWRVDVVDANGNIIGSRAFTIKSISNTY